MKDKIIKLILKSIMLGWIFMCQTLMMIEMFYGGSMVYTFVFFLFGIQGLKLYLDAK